ncbi:sterile alpha motif domain-containing protein 15 [Acomys russatus]|uniref:sterile alpha motif domain-containing protein 15 n=1 Tax=Acomys russatus TaxID=60746 RepID=UPI0021E1EA1A|nr:sterile alpha motif domain-containing protein 15 [Acomys russatus]
MAEVPEDYDSDPDEIRPKKAKSLRSHKLPTVKSDTTVEVSSELPPETDQEPEELNLQEELFEEGKAGSVENALLEPTWMSEEENPQETNMDLPRPTEGEIMQTSELETPWGTGEEDLEVPEDEKPEEPDLQSSGVPVDVLTELPTETDTQLPTETKVPEATSSEPELPEQTWQSVSEGAKDIGPEQNTPDFPNGKPRKSVEEDTPPPSEMVKSETTEKTQEDSAEEESEEPSQVTKPEPPDQKLRKPYEEADLTPPEEHQVKFEEQLGTEQPEQIEPTFPDKEQSPSSKEKVPEPLEELKLELSEEESRKPIDEESLDLPEKTARKSFEENIPETLEKTALGLTKEIKPDVQGETQGESIEEKLPEPLEDKKPTDQEEKLRGSSEKSKSKETIVSATEKGPVLQEQPEPEFPKKNLIKSTEETGQVPPQLTKPKVQEKSQLEPTKDKNLGLSVEPKPKEREREFPKEDSTKPTKYPVEKDVLEYSKYYKKVSEKEAKAKHEHTLGSPRESMESIGTDNGSQEVLRGLEAHTNELFPTIPASESRMKLRGSVSEKKVVVLPKEGENLESKESKINISPQFEHLKWSVQNVADWISELGFPQYKECFTANFISGPKLIHVNCSNLPQMGITDFEDMKAISRHTRELLGITEPLFSRSISLPYRDNIGLFLERKSHSGVNSDALTFAEFIEASGLQEYGPAIKAMDKNEGSLTDNSEEEK